MDSQVSDSVDQVEDRKTWTDAVLASLRPSDHHVRDEEIFEILGAGREGEAAAELFAAKGVTLPMYCVWKAKYRHLSLEELRSARRLELWRARSLAGVLVAVVALGIGGVVFALARVAQANITGAAASVAAERPSTPLNPEAAESGNVPARSAAFPTGLPTTEPAVERREPTIEAGLAGDTNPEPAFAPAPEAPVGDESLSAAPSATTETGYRIQVAAAPTLQEGRVLLERLASAGYPAYLLRATISGVEVFRVRIGPFDTLESAAEVVSHLQRDGYKGAWIAR